MLSLEQAIKDQVEYNNQHKGKKYAFLMQLNLFVLEINNEGMRSDPNSQDTDFKNVKGRKYASTWQYAFMQKKCLEFHVQFIKIRGILA